MFLFSILQYEIQLPAPPPLYTRLVLLLALVFIGFSCNKEETQAVSNENFELTLTKDQIESVGVLHNEHLTEAIQNFDFTATKPKVELVSRIKSLGIEGIDGNYLAEGYLETEAQQFKSELSDQAMVIVSRIEEGMTNIQNLDAFVSFLELEEEKVKEILHGTERSAVMVFISVTKKSAELWLPAELGGSGIGYAFMQRLALSYNRDFSFENESKAPSWIGKVLKADGFAAASGFLVTAAGWAIGSFVATSAVATGGLSVAVIAAALGAIAGSSAMASGIMAISLITP